MVQLSEQTLEHYRHNIEKRHWIPWEEFLSLKVGDTFEMPYFDCGTDNVIGTQVLTIKEKSTKNSTDYWDKGLEHGILSCDAKVKTGTKENEGFACGTFSVNLNDAQENKSQVSTKEDIIKAAVSYVNNHRSGIDLREFETYLRNV